MPFLQNVTCGRGIPTERLAEVGRHYMLFGGKSLINDQCRSLPDGVDERITQSWAVAAALLGNRNRAPTFMTNVRSSETVIGGYLSVTMPPVVPLVSAVSENLFDAVQGTQIQVDRIRHYANHPGFAQASVDAPLRALESLGERAEERPPSL